MKKPTTRKDRALVTRRRMIASAHHLFVEQGYVATTMTAIAKDAEVAVQTLYFTFHTKGAILGEVLGAAIFGPEAWQGPPPSPAFGAKGLRSLHPWFEAIEAEPNRHRALERFIEHNEGAIRRAGPLIAVMHAAGDDPDARAVFELGKRRQAEAYRTFVETLAKKRGGLRKKLSVSRATDILLVIFSGETATALLDRGWSSAQCRRWFLEILGHQLLGEVMAK